MVSARRPRRHRVDDAELARKVGVVCLVAILYEGGLDIVAAAARGCRSRPS
jgi:hypothetical protein